MQLTSNKSQTVNCNAILLPPLSKKCENDSLVYIAVNQILLQHLQSAILLARVNPHAAEPVIFQTSPSGERKHT